MISRRAGFFALAGACSSWRRAGSLDLVSADARRIPPRALSERAESLRGHLQGEGPKCSARVIFNPPVEASWEATCPACGTHLRLEGETAFVK